MSTKSKLNWMMLNQPNNLWVINQLREKLGLKPLPPTVEGKGLRFEAVRNWKSRERSSN